MLHFFTKSLLVKATIIFCYTLISSCSFSLQHKKKNSSNLYYLNTNPLIDLYAPEGMILPIQSSKYDIPSKKQK